MRRDDLDAMEIVGGGIIKLGWPMVSRQTCKTW